MAKSKSIEFTGRLVVPPSKHGDGHWAKLEIPEALAQGLFSSLGEPGVAPSPGNAHITVMGEDEVAKLGGPDAISEKGRTYNFRLGRVKSVNPSGWQEMKRVWFITCYSPELKALRKAHGLDPKHKGHDFHITFAVKRRAKMAEVVKESQLTPEQVQLLKRVAVGGGLGLAGGAVIDRLRRRGDEDEDEGGRRKSFLSRNKAAITGLLLGGGLGGLSSALKREAPAGSPRTPLEEVEDPGAVTAPTEETTETAGPPPADLVERRNANIAVAQERLNLSYSQGKEDYIAPFLQDNPEVLDMSTQEVTTMLDKLDDSLDPAVGASYDQAAAYALGTTPEPYPHALDYSYRASKNLDTLVNEAIVDPPLGAQAAIGGVGAPAFATMGAAGKALKKMVTGGPAGRAATMAAIKSPAAWKALMMGGAGAGAAGAVGGAVATRGVDKALKGLGLDASNFYMDAYGNRIALPGVAKLVGEGTGFAAAAPLGVAAATGSLAPIKALGKTIKGAPSKALTAYLGAAAGGGAYDLGQMVGDPTGYQRRAADDFKPYNTLGYGGQVAKTLLEPHKLIGRTGAMIGGVPTMGSEVADSRSKLEASIQSQLAGLRQGVRQGAVPGAKYIETMRRKGQQLYGETPQFDDFVRQQLSNVRREAQ